MGARVTLVLWGMAGLVALMCLAGLSVGSVVARPMRTTIGPPPPDFPAAPVAIPSPSGTTLSGWLARGRRGAGGVLLLHGVRSNRLSMLRRARFLQEAGYSVLLFDFQGHGESPGQRITFGSLESLDARAALAFLRNRVPGERIGAIGVSLGGAAALLGPQPFRVEALIVESVYPTIGDAVANRLRLRLGPLGPALVPLFTLQLRAWLGVSASDLQPIERIDALSSPVFILAGTADRHTTLDEARWLFARAREPKLFWAVEGAAHVDLHAYSPNEYENRVLAFLARYLRPNQGSAPL